jgi:hypothetical protein
MILDGLLFFTGTGSTAPTDSLIAGTGTLTSTNVIDLGLIGLPASAAGGGGARDIGVGDDPAMKVLAQITTAIAGTNGTTTIQVKIQGAPDAGSNTPGTYYDMVLSPVQTLNVPTGNLLTAGARLLEVDVPRYPAGQPVPRYLRMQYIIAGAAITAGALEAMLVLDRFDQIGSQSQALSGYPAGVVIAN